MLSIANNTAAVINRGFISSRELDDPLAPPSIREPHRLNAVVPHDMVRDAAPDNDAANRPSLRARRRAALFVAGRNAAATAISSAIQYAIYSSPKLQDQEARFPSTATIILAASLGGLARQAVADCLAKQGPTIGSHRKGFSRYHNDAPTCPGKTWNCLSYAPNALYIGWATLAGVAAGATAYVTGGYTAADLMRCSLATSWLPEAMEGYTTAMYESGRAGATIEEHPLPNLSFGLPSVGTAASTISNASARGLCSSATSFFLKYVLAGLRERGPKLIAQTSIEGAGALNGFVRGMAYVFRPQLGEAIKQTVVEPTFKSTVKAVSAFARWTGLSRSSPTHQVETNDPVLTAAQLAEEGRSPFDVPPVPVTQPSHEFTLPNSPTLESEYDTELTAEPRNSRSASAIFKSSGHQEIDGTSIDMEEPLPRTTSAGPAPTDNEANSFARGSIELRPRASAPHEQSAQADGDELARPSSFETARPLTPGISNRDARTN